MKGFAVSKSVFLNGINRSPQSRYRPTLGLGNGSGGGGGSSLAVRPGCDMPTDPICPAVECRRFSSRTLGADLCLPVAMIGFRVKCPHPSEARWYHFSLSLWSYAELVPWSRSLAGLSRMNRLVSWFVMNQCSDRRRIPPIGSKGNIPQYSVSTGAHGHGQQLRVHIWWIPRRLVQPKKQSFLHNPYEPEQPLGANDGKNLPPT